MARIYLYESDRERLIRHISNSMLASIVHELSGTVPEQTRQLRMDQIARRAAENLLKDYRLVPRRRR